MHGSGYRTEQMGKNEQKSQHLSDLRWINVVASIGSRTERKKKKDSEEEESQCLKIHKTGTECMTVYHAALTS